MVDTMIIRVSKDGRITIPASVRRRLGIKPGSQVRIEIDDGKIIIRPVRSISDIAGIARKYAEDKTTDWDAIREETMLAVAWEEEVETGRWRLLHRHQQHSSPHHRRRTALLAGASEEPRR